MSPSLWCPKSQKRCDCFRAARNPLFILVSLGLLGLTIEAYFINRLYHLVPAVTTQTPNTTSGVQHDNHLSGWSRICGMEYKDGKLVVQKEGHYYVYSKVHVSFRDSSIFRLSVELNRPGYEKAITLMKSIKYSQTAHDCTGRDPEEEPCRQIVLDTSHSCHFSVKLNRPDDDFFGAFMI